VVAETVIESVKPIILSLPVLAVIMLLSSANAKAPEPAKAVPAAPALVLALTKPELIAVIFRLSTLLFK